MFKPTIGAPNDIWWFVGHLELSNIWLQTSGNGFNMFKPTIYMVIWGIFFGALVYTHVSMSGWSIDLFGWHLLTWNWFNGLNWYEILYILYQHIYSYRSILYIYISILYKYIYIYWHETSIHTNWSCSTGRTRMADLLLAGAPEIVTGTFRGKEWRQGRGEWYRDSRREGEDGLGMVALHQNLRRGSQHVPTPDDFLSDMPICPWNPIKSKDDCFVSGW